MSLYQRKINAAVISSYPPRKCGIATFTNDLVTNMTNADPTIVPRVLVLQNHEKLKYTKPVRILIDKNSINDYIAVADFINSSNIDIVILQHEFGLYGGAFGQYLSVFLKRLNKPLITTLHTILAKPEKGYWDSFKDVCEYSDLLIVMNKLGVSMLTNIYKVASSKILLIAHGIPDLPFESSSSHKDQLGFRGRKTILTFGLLGRNKGIEYMLRAMPDVIKVDPSVLYIILGATHPEVIKHEGHSYKNELLGLVDELGIRDNVLFYNHFVSDRQLHKFLAAADIYVTPYLYREQLTSGTLAFAVGSGKAVVSTPYWAAQELLADGRGKLVRFRDSRHLGETICQIINDRVLFNQLRLNAYNYGRAMTWPKIGQKYSGLIRNFLTKAPVRYWDIVPSIQTVKKSKTRLYQSV